MLHSTPGTFDPISLYLFIEQMPPDMGATDQDDSQQVF